eukprot:2103494-Rhodomonas_salina.2
MATAPLSSQSGQISSAHSDPTGAQGLASAVGVTVLLLWVCDALAWACEGRVNPPLLLHSTACSCFTAQHVANFTLQVLPLSARSTPTD